MQQSVGVKVAELYARMWLMEDDVLSREYLWYPSQC